MTFVRCLLFVATICACITSTVAAPSNVLIESVGEVPPADFSLGLRRSSREVADEWTSLLSTGANGAGSGSGASGSCQQAISETSAPV